jgi:hypothetical protein
MWPGARTRVLTHSHIGIYSIGIYCDKPNNEPSLGTDQEWVVKHPKIWGLSLGEKPHFITTWYVASAKSRLVLAEYYETLGDEDTWQDFCRWEYSTMYLKVSDVVGVRTKTSWDVYANGSRLFPIGYLLVLKGTNFWQARSRYIKITKSWTQNEHKKVINEGPRGYIS